MNKIPLPFLVKEMHALLLVGKHLHQLILIDLMLVWQHFDENQKRVELFYLY